MVLKIYNNNNNPRPGAHVWSGEVIRQRTEEVSDVLAMFFDCSLFEFIELHSSQLSSENLLKNG